MVLLLLHQPPQAMVLAEDHNLPLRVLPPLPLLLLLLLRQ